MTRASDLAKLIAGSSTIGGTGELVLKDVDTADGSSPKITFQTGDTDIEADDVLGTIDFQAPDEGTGTDALLVAAGIEAVSEGAFSSSSNATKLVFKTGASETAASKMTLSSSGVLDVDGGVTVDNITIDGTEIDLSSGDLTIDVAGGINLDSDDGEISFKDDGTEIGKFNNSSSNFAMEAGVQDKDILFKGNDGGSAITALTLDMSNAGAATFNNDVTAFSDKRLKTDIYNIENGLEKVMKMQGVHYKRKDVNNAKPQVGVLAQDMEVIVPEIVLTADDEMQTKSVDYGKLTAVLIEAIKELKAEIDELRKG